MAALDSTVQASGGDYTTHASWHSAVPSSPTGIQRAMTAAEAFVISSEIHLDGKSPTSAANGIHITCQAGASWRERVPFVGWSSTSHARWTYTGAQSIINIEDSYTRVIGMQGICTTTDQTNGIFETLANNTSGYEDCFVISDGSDDECYRIYSGAYCKNCYAVSTGENGEGFLSDSSSTVFYNCFCFATYAGGSTGDGFRIIGGTPVTHNCISFNYAVPFEAMGGDYNASDDTSGPGANALDNLTPSDHVVNVASDLSLKNGSSLIDAGNTHANNLLDVLGRTRDATTDGDIGPMEGLEIQREQAAFRVYDEDGSAIAAEDVQGESAVSTPFVPVIMTQTDGDAPAESPTWKGRKKGDADTEWETLQ